MYFLKDINYIVDNFAKLASEDILVYTYVPRKGIEYVREVGLLSASLIIKDKKALSLSRPNNKDQYIKDIEEKLSDPDWEDIVKGISAFFTLPDFSSIKNNHNIFKFDLVPIKINLSKLIKDKPSTKLLGVELSKGKKGERELNINDVEKYTELSPNKLWEKYIAKNNMYAPNVPHLIIITDSFKIPPKYIIS